LGDSLPIRRGGLGQALTRGYACPVELREGIIYIITTTISLRLCVFARIKKEKIIGAQSRQAAKSAAAESQTVRTTISLRLCALARVKNKKSIWLPAILRGRQRRQDGKAVRRGGKSYRADHNFFAALRLGEKKNPPRRTSKDGKAPAILRGWLQRVRLGGQALREEKTLFLRFKNPVARKFP
jgi:hypothetical protein